MKPDLEPDQRINSIEHLRKIYDKECAWCGKKFQAQKTAKFCSNRCRQANKYQNIRKIYENECAWCGKKFQGRKNARCCSTFCKALDDNRKRKEKKAEEAGK